MDESTLLALAPSPEVFDAGTLLFKRGQLSELKRTSDNTLLFARCQGSGSEPYEIAADLAPERPWTRCSCPSRKRPCKHALALLFAYWKSGAQAFAESSAPADLLEERAKRAKPAKPAAAATDEAKPKKPRASNKAALAKKAQAQLEGLAAAEKVLGDLAVSGLGTQDAARLAALRTRATELADFYLPGMATTFRRLALLLESEEAADVQAPRAARLLAQLWAMARKGRALLEQKLEDEPQAPAESDAVLEELLGKVWHLDELKEKGFVLRELTLLELAYARADDDAREERIETSYLLDVRSGDVLRDVTYVPARRISKELPKPSYAALDVAEAAVYPGFLNHRVRWEESAARERSLTPDDLRAAGERALSIPEAVKRFQAQAKNLLAPDSAVLLVRTARAGKVGDAWVVEDAQGARLALTPSPALEWAGWPANTTALLAELSLEPGTSRVRAVPMTVLAPDRLIRLTF